MKGIRRAVTALVATAFITTNLARAQQAASPAAAVVPAPAAAGEMADLFTKNCAPCHGTDLAGGRGPSLFADSLLSKSSDDALRQTIREGRVDAGMPAFKGQLSDEEIGRLLAYLRIRGGQLKGRPSFLADPNGQIVKSSKQSFRIEVVAANLNTPWGEVFLPDGRMLVTERPGRLRIIDHGKLLPDPVKNAPLAWARQDGGYFDIALHPQYKRNGWIYLSFSEVAPGLVTPAPDDPATPRAALPPAPPSMTRLVRGRLNARNEWVDQQDIFRAPAELYTPSVIHYGSRFLFDGKGHLFWTMGDRGDKSNGQNLGSPLGKIHRVNDDGSAPRDNPFVNTPGALPSIWSYGHRNPEGLAFDPRTGRLWETEHGPTGGDEVNIVEKGHNYGWGVISMGLEPGITDQHRAGMEDPITYYSPSIGPSGMSFYTGRRYPGWKNSLFLSALAGQRLIRYEIKDRAIASQEAVYQGFGRTRAVITGPDGYLYILLQNSQTLANSPGMVIRLLPTK
jgi:glucose/arabinose dehydrogenase/cytochrome c553